MPVAPNSDPAEDFLRRFYEWELRGRGWDVWPEAIELEPPFVPFYGHYVDLSPIADDGKEHTFLSRLVQRFRDFVSHAPRIQPPPSPQMAASPQLDDSTDESVELQVILPRDFDPPKDLMARCLLSLSMCNRHLAFELLGDADSIHIQFAVDPSDAELVEHQLASFFPEISLLNQEEILRTSWVSGGEHMLLAEMGLAREFMLPLLFQRQPAIDTLTAATAALQRLSSGEVAGIQVLFAPVRHAWAESVVRSVTMPDGSPLFEGFRDFVPAARTKVAHPLFATVLRIFCRSDDEDRVPDIARHIAASFSALGCPEGNELKALSNDDYAFDDHEQDFLKRRTHRTGMLLNSIELSALVQMPSSSVQAPKLRGAIKRTKAAPPVASSRELILGENQHAGRTQKVGLTREQRSRHMHIIGASGTGKSQLLLNMIVQDMDHGDGLAVLDPHGDLIDDVLLRVPETRVDDVVIIDPSDEEYTVGFNILSANTEIEKTVLASDLVAVFQRLSTSWGDQMTSVLGNAVMAFLERPEGGTLADLRRFLIEQPFRAEVLSTVKDPEVVYYWKKQFPLLRGSPQASVLTRLDIFLRRKPIRHMVCQRQKTLDFADTMDTGKIVLAKIPQGLLGDENAHLLGTILVSKFHQLAMARQEKEISKRRHFWLYIDEFHHFVTPSMSSILTEARKYRLGLILAHQELRQLDSRGTDTTSAVLSNPYTRICFRVGDHDARKLAEGFSSFDAQDLQSLSTGEAICRLERSDFDFNLTTKLIRASSDPRVEERSRTVLERSRTKYAIRRSEITEEAPAVMEPADVILKQRPVEETVPAKESQPPPVSKATRAKPTKSVHDPADEPAPMGRGGPNHVYLQQLIKQWAEGMGYRASIEYKLPRGGSVDVLLEKGSRRIACETTITNTPAYELGNIRKCLEADCGFVIAVGIEQKHLTKVEAAAKPALTAAELQRTKFLLLDGLFEFIQELEIQDAAKQQTVRGYNVKTAYQKTDPKEQAARRQVINEVVAKAMKRLGKRK